MQRLVFYSWQSDHPNAVNRGFISQCLGKAVRGLANDGGSSIYEVDRDTQGVPGTPDIVATIFDKIQRADIFVGDVTIVTGQESQRPSPNPNVLVELGYAARHLGWHKIICVANLHYGKTEQLPFDLRPRRILTYTMSPSGDEKGPIREELAGKLTAALVEIASDKPRFVKSLQEVFDRINPAIILHIRAGRSEISINLTSRNEAALRELRENPLSEQFFEIVSNGNWMSNNTNDNGGVNDVGPGPLLGYNLVVREPLRLNIT